MIVVNGVQIHTDKQLQSIIGSRAVFADGSWCDVTTRAVQNQGPGYLGFAAGGGDASDVSDKTHTRRESFAGARVIEMGNLPGLDVEVIPTDNTEVHLEIEASQAVHDALHAEIVGSLFRLRSTSSAVGGGGISVAGDYVGGVISSGSGNVIISGDGYGRNVQVRQGSAQGGRIRLQIPAGIPVRMGGQIGRAVIGDIRAPLSVSLQGSAEVIAGSVTDCELSVQGSADVEVASVAGDVRVAVQGSGDARIEGGRARTLDARVQGSGSFRFDGVAERASLTVQGSGDIRVEQVTGAVSESSMGSGRIRIRKRHA